MTKTRRDSRAVLGGAVAALLLATFAFGFAGPAAAQCQVANAPYPFDPSGVSLPSYLVGTQSLIAMGGTPTARRLAVRYNYGFLVYDVTSGQPNASTFLQKKDLLAEEKYPKNGDGQSRAGALSMSPDGQRIILPWADSAGYGAIAFSFAGTYSGGGDFPPKGSAVVATAAARSGSRYLGFSAANTIDGVKLFVSDLTTMQRGVQAEGSRGSIKSEAINTAPIVPIASSGLRVVESASKTYLVAWGGRQVLVGDISNPGAAVPGLSANFTWRSYSAEEFGLGAAGGTFRSAAVAFHPATGELHIFAEISELPSDPFRSAGIALARVSPASGNLTVLGTAQVPSTARRTLPSSLLLPSGADLVAVHFEVDESGVLYPHVRSASDLSQNLAAGITFSRPTGFVTLEGFMTASGRLNLFFGVPENAFAASLDCATAPTPLVASLSLEKVPAGGGTATVVPEGGTVFLGDELRVKPAFSPSNAVSPVLDWRLDYDYHAASPLEASVATPRLANPDLVVTEGGSIPAQLTLVGPCDPAQAPTPVPASGAGCWTSVTTNGGFTGTGNPDFAVDPLTGDPAPGATVPLTVAFEARNSINGSGSSVATQAVNWKVPRALLKSASILSGGTLVDASEGSPATSGFKWYISSVPVGQAGDDVLALKAACTGPTCPAGLTAAGSYRYWVTVPYRNGFATPACPGLSTDGLSCTGQADRTVQVTDVVLGFNVPSAAFQSTATVTIPSASLQGTGVTACSGTSGFTYDLCQVNGASCPAGSFTGNGLVVTSPFSAGGSLSIPTPAVGSYGVRIRYTYSTSPTAGCAATTVAQWPSSGNPEADWAPLTVSLVDPRIKLLSSTTGESLCDWSDENCYIELGKKGKAYVYIQNGAGDYVVDSNPPAITWSFGSGLTGSGQGAEFSYTSAKTYTITLNGYGAPKTKDIQAFAQVGGGGGGTGGTGGTGGGGGGGTALSVTSISFSNNAPAAGSPVNITCNAYGGTAPYSYFFAFGDGGSQSSNSSTVSHVYSAAGVKYVGCTVTDASSVSAQLVVALGVVASGGGGGDGGTSNCNFTIKNALGAALPFFSNYFEATKGQPLTFEATDVTGTPSWNFGDSQTAVGNPVTHTYNFSGTTTQEYMIQLTAGGGCSVSHGIYVAPQGGATMLDFSILDAGTSTALARSGNTFEAKAGQALKFSPVGTDGAVSWNFGDGETSAEASPVKTYGPLVDTTYTVTLTNNAQTKQYSVAVKGSTGAPLTGGYTYKYSDGTSVNRTAVQPNRAVTFTASDQATSYQWDFGDGTPLGQGSPIQHTFTQGGSFTVRLTTARAGVTPVTTANPLPLTVLRPPDPLLWVAAGMAYADGSKGELFQSDLSIFNPGTQPASVSLAFVAGATWDGVSKAEWRTLGLGPGETRAFSNILGTFFSLPKGAWGVVLVRGDSISLPPVIVGRTYNAADPDTGTFGLSVPAMSVANGVKPQSSAASSFLAGLRHDASFRTNLTVANLKDETAEVEVVFRDALGQVLGVPARVRVEARGVKQLNGALAAAPVEGDAPIGGAGFGAGASHFSAEIRLKQGTGVYPYATVIDQGTGDSIVVTPSAHPDPSIRVPGIVRVKGKSGAYWTSDIAILNPSAKERKLRITYSYVKTGTSLRIDASQSVTFAPYELKVGIDFVKVWLGLAADDPYGYAASYVDIAPAPDDTSPNEPVVVTGKTYIPSGRGSVGLQIDPFGLEDGISAQGSNKRIVLSGLVANAKYRTNVALFMTPGSTGNVQVDIHVYDSYGRESKKFLGVGLDANTPFVQLNSSDLFAGLTTDDLSRATVVIDSPRGSATVAAYATAIDETSEDATFVAGQPMP